MNNQISSIERKDVFDVVIIGGGTGGVSAGYALKGKGYSVAMASARINMTMAQLGWAVGNASCLCLDGKLENVQQIAQDRYMKVLQSDQYTQFDSRVKVLESNYCKELQDEISLLKNKLQ